jgi:hypothetical protein
MVELLVHRHGEAILNEAVTFLRQGGDPRLLLDHLSGSNPITGQALLEFLQERHFASL